MTNSNLYRPGRKQHEHHTGIFDNLASYYPKVFQDMQETMQEQAEMLDRIFTTTYS